MSASVGPTPSLETSAAAAERGAVIVTGAGAGIGAAAARRLAADGRRVVVVDIAGDSARAVADDLEHAMAVEADVSSEAGVAAYMDAALTTFGAIDGLFLNAGVVSGSPLIESSADDFDRVVAINLRGVFLGLRDGLRHFRDAGHAGAIVVTASTSSVSGSVLAAYGATKHAVAGLVKTAALEGAPLGVRVNAIAPGPTDTSILRAPEELLGGGEEARLTLAATTPLGREQGRYGRPEEVAAAVAFLLGDEASWMTGTLVPVDGGLLAKDPYT